ncbi:MAG TPA: radical SAM protein [Bacteroidales bacterium]|nr:radical SAM protein [Bacteroidales bacterium]HXK81750.1 radical SAM protein [Bacteroidales bacterium]
MQDTSFRMEIFNNYENKIFWTISNFCNFRCPYCYIDKTQKPEYITEHHTPEHIANCFNKTGKTWLIMLAGGEPFIMPKFLPLMQELTKNHHIQISTNLCSDDVFKFPEYVTPEKVMVISASLHVPEREKVDPKFEKFIEKCLFLQDKGFRVVVNYVTWSPLLTRIEKDFKYLKSKGIKNMTAFTFLGEYDGKPYPESYTEDEIKLISKLSMYKREEDILRCSASYKGIKCEAGHRYFTTELDGTVYKCRSIPTAMGNILDGSFKPDTKNRKCTADTCIDTYMAEFILDHNKRGVFGFLKKKQVKI